MWAGLAGIRERPDVDSSISHDPFAPDSRFEGDDGTPKHFGEDADTVAALRKLAGKRLLHSYEKKVADVSP